MKNTNLKILISGFEPFGQHTKNISEEFINCLQPSSSLDTCVLPVAFEQSWSVLQAKIIETRPDFLMMLGLAENRNQLSWERIAVNWQSARIPDNKGQTPLGSKIDNLKADGFMGALPPWPISAAKNETIAECSWQSSWSAGTYVCNEIFFRALASQQLNREAISFIHIPGKAPEPTQKIFESIQAVIEMWTGLKVGLDCQKS